MTCAEPPDCLLSRHYFVFVIAPLEGTKKILTFFQVLMTLPWPYQGFFGRFFDDNLDTKHYQIAKLTNTFNPLLENFQLERYSKRQSKKYKKRYFLPLS